MVNASVRLLLVGSLLSSTSLYAMEPKENLEDDNNKIVIIKNESDLLEQDCKSSSQLSVVNRVQEDTWGSYVTSGVSYLTGYIYNLSDNVKSSISFMLEKSAQIKKARLEFKEGIDLYQPLKEYWNQPSDFSEQVAKHIKVTIDYMNLKRDEIPAPMAIIMQGFAGKMGTQVEMLIKNLNLLVGPKLTADLSKQLGLTQMLCEKGTNFMLKNSNPFGWASSLLSVLDTTTYVATLAQNNILKRLHSQIEEVVAKKLGIPKDLLEKKRLAEIAFKKFEENKKNKIVEIKSENQLIKFDQNAENNYNEAKANYQLALQNFGISLRTIGEELIVGYFKAPDENMTPEQIKNKEIRTEEYRTIADLAKAKLLMVTFEDTVEGLQNTARKTLASLMNDIEGGMKEKLPENVVMPMVTVLRPFILGIDEKSEKALKLLSYVANGNSKIAPVNKGSSFIKKMFNKPVTFLKGYTPKIVSDKINDCADLINGPVGETVGKKLSKKMNDDYIEGSLKNIKLFSEEQMKLNLVKYVESAPVPVEVKQLISFTDMALSETIGGLDDLVKPMLHNVGETAAELLLEISLQQLQPILKEHGIEHDVKDLTTKEIELPKNYIEKGFSKMGALKDLFSREKKPSGGES